MNKTRVQNCDVRAASHSFFSWGLPFIKVIMGSFWWEVGKVKTVSSIIVKHLHVANIIIIVIIIILTITSTVIISLNIIVFIVRRSRSYCSVCYTPYSKWLQKTQSLLFLIVTSTTVMVDESGWQWMKLDERGWKWMKVSAVQHASLISFIMMSSRYLYLFYIKNNHISYPVISSITGTSSSYGLRWIDLSFQTNHISWHFMRSWWKKRFEPISSSHVTRAKPSSISVSLCFIPMKEQC